MVSGRGANRGVPVGMLVALSLTVVALPGCALINGFLDPTKVGQFPWEYKERGVRRTLTVRETPPGLPNATEPTPEDLVPIYEDYRLVPGDVLTVVIPDLITPGGAPENLALEVSSTGQIRIPLLGAVKVSGLTEQEVEQELKSRLREAELLPDADVRVYAQAKRNRVFTVRGAVGRSGQYSLVEPNTRLLDIIGLVQDVAATAQKLYVIRQTRAGATAPAVEPRGPEPEGWIPPPPIEPASYSPSFSTAQGLGGQPPPETRPGETMPSKADLDALLTPRQASRPASQGAGAEPEPMLPPIIFDPQTGQLMERAPGTRPAAAKAAPEESRRPAEPTEPPAEEPFRWEPSARSESEQRVIEIDVKGLFAGDPRYNIVIRDRDVISVPPDTGLFYVMGEVNRPGVYSFNGRDITLKQAVAVTGGFSVLAWPQRCEIIRHEPGTDAQVTIPVNADAIFAGLADDVYMRDNDILNVGTHFVAPFLYVIRNSFRFTYGFGFVYDRNFADVDAYGAKQNPETVREARRAARGLPF